ncbi:MAG TPA: DUF4333 domain-containing protein [Acidimicrobiia bacterium]
MARVRWWPVLVTGALALALGGCGGSDHGSVDMGVARTGILQLASRQYRGKATVGEVKCPEDVPLEKGRAFFCTVELDGVPLRLVLRQTDDGGDTHIAQAESVLLVPQLDAFVARYANGRGRPVADVSCGKGRVLTEKPGTRVRCSVTYANGSNGRAVIGVKDTKDNYVLVSITP